MPSARTSAPARRFPQGAEVVPGGVHLRVWAPACRALEAVFEGQRSLAIALDPEPGGYFAGFAEGRGAGDRYKLRLDGGDLLPDPASRFQPEGPHGPSEIVDPAAFPWRVHNWKGVTMKGLVVYELHVGTFSREGTWAGAARRLPELADLGVTAVEVMPVAEVPGRFNWGYDGVDLYAPTRNYGRPDDFRAFVDRAHELGLGVVLDVVYNHLGPDGNYLRRFAPAYFSDRITEWGEALNYDGPDSGPVRDFMTGNAAYWISEYRLDGLRFDATQSIFDASDEPIFAAFSRAARAAARERSIVLISENETQEARFVAAPEKGGYGFDGLWNDDYHHALRVALTGRREAYYQDYRGSAAELVACVKKGYLYQGQYYSWQGKRRGTPTHGTPPEAFVAYLENHDQVANATPQGRRLVDDCAAGPLRAATALLLLGPATPLLFQGQEDGGGVPFVFFADHNPELARLVSKGRRDFMAQFPCMAGEAARAAVPDPADRAAFESCLAETGRDDAKTRAWRALHKDLLTLRRTDRILSAPAPGSVDANALGPRSLCVRWFAPDAGDRLLTVNLGDDLALDCVSEPLLAPPPGMRWADMWASEDPRYGGDGTPPLDERHWKLVAGTAQLLRAVPEEAPRGDA